MSNQQSIKQRFIDLAYSKFGIKANENITIEQSFEIIDEIELLDSQTKTK